MRESVIPSTVLLDNRAFRTDHLAADLKDAVFMLLTKEIITISRAAEMLQCRVRDVREMLSNQ